MKIIQEANRLALDMCKPTIDKVMECANTNLHPHAYMMIEKCDEGTIMYNTITKEIVLFEEGDDLFAPHFRENMWLLPNDTEDPNLALQFREGLFNRRPKTVAPRGYTIVTTTDCNARCFYCYEQGIARKNMTHKTASDLADYIIKNYKKMPKNNDSRPEVTLSWFGGEPLFNKKVIDIVCGKLREADVKYRSSMISNGYLFDEETVKTAKNDWNLRNVQITLDGTEENYNKAKNYIDKSVSPFKVVTDNIERLAESGIRVSIRINVGYYNREDIEKLVDYIGERYGRGRGVSLYLHTLFEKSGITDIDSEEKEREVYEKITEIEEKAERLGIHSEKTITPSVRGTHCMADNGSHVTVQTDGHLCLCEHYVDTFQMGSIYEEGFNQKVIDKFKEISAPFDRCFWCPIFPECSTLMICEDNEGDCTAARQGYKLDKKIRALKRVAGKFLHEEKMRKEQENAKVQNEEEVKIL